jgi:hypothetical protein
MMRYSARSASPGAMPKAPASGRASSKRKSGRSRRVPISVAAQARGGGATGWQGRAEQRESQALVLRLAARMSWQARTILNSSVA